MSVEEASFYSRFISNTSWLKCYKPRNFNKRKNMFLFTLVKQDVMKTYYK